MGGEWCGAELTDKLKTANEMGFDTCLYTGLEQVDSQIAQNLTWLKTGPFIKELGGLESPTTNQRFIEVKSNTILNHLFLKTT